MPIHDWTRVIAGTFHDFHLAWIAELRKELNDGLLPDGYYAQAEQIIGPFGPDVLALEEPGPPGEPATDRGGVAVAVAQPRMRHRESVGPAGYTAKRRKVVIRHGSGDRIVALIEIVSPGNKANLNNFRSFIDKAAECLARGYHLLIVDLFPPGPRDPGGVHAALWSEFADGAVELAADEPLTLAAYSAGPVKEAYLEPTAVGRELIDMPLFLDPETYVNVPLEQTYRAAYRGVPRKWKDVLEAPAGA
jgi:hypothetical protein